MLPLHVGRQSSQLKSCEQHLHHKLHALLRIEAAQGATMVGCTSPAFTASIFGANPSASELLHQRQVHPSSQILLADTCTLRIVMYPKKFTQATTGSYPFRVFEKLEDDASPIPQISCVTL